jgi:hypothetical protein
MSNLFYKKSSAPQSIRSLPFGSEKISKGSAKRSQACEETQTGNSKTLPNYSAKSARAKLSLPFGSEPLSKNSTPSTRNSADR